MDEVSELYRYLPVFSPNEQDYLNFLKSEIENSYTGGAYQSAYLSSHILFMFYVYSCIWKIKRVYNERYYFGIIGFPKYRDKENGEVDLRELDSVFNLSLVREKTIFDVFKLVNMDNGEIGKLKNSIDTRNNIAHSTGHIDFTSEAQFSGGLSKLIEHCKRIHKTMKNGVIRPAYESYLLDNTVKEDWEYSEITEQVKEMLLHYHRLSEIEFLVCSEFGISRFSDRNNYQLEAEEIQTIQEVHSKVKEVGINVFGWEE